MNSFSQLSSSVPCRIDKGFRALGKSNLEIPELVYDQAKFLQSFSRAFQSGSVLTNIMELMRRVLSHFRYVFFLSFVLKTL